MSLIDRIQTFFSLPPFDTAPVQARAGTDTTDFDTALAAIVSRRAVGPWRMPTVREALGVPAIFRAVSLIANTTGSLVMEGYRNGTKLPQADAPNIIVRPNPRTTPRAFYRDSAYYLATRGECWWWVAMRDGDGNALSLVVVPPWEVTVEPNDRDRLRPVIKWLDKTIPNRDMRQITFLSDDANIYRGVGPLQLCGAAISVAVESQEFAANYFAGSPSNTLIRSSVPLSGTKDADGYTEADYLKMNWMEATAGLPRVVDSDIEDVKDISVDPAKAQLTDTRHYSAGDAARMFGIPGALLEFAESGTSLYYKNVESIWREFQQGCLSPNYLEPIEQEMSDLLTRSTVSRFNVRGMLRTDPKTRADIYNILIPLGIMTSEMAAAEEGYIAGDSEFAPVPFAAPQAIPASLPIESRAAAELVEVRCDGPFWLRGRQVTCNRLLGHAAPPYSFTCPRCGKVTNAA